MSSYGSAGDLSSAFHPYRSVDPKEYEPALRQNTILTVEVDDDCAGLASNLMYSQGGHDVKTVSYTHLDVYKRQVNKHLIWLQKPFLFFLRKPQKRPQAG